MTQSSSEEKWNSPGNAYVLNADTPKMKRPDMEFIWRLECEIAKEEIEIGAPHGTGVVRSVANILDGKMSGPGIEGVVLPGGADWATCIEGTHVSFFSVLGVGGFESGGAGGGGKTANSSFRIVTQIDPRKTIWGWVVLRFEAVTRANPTTDTVNAPGRPLHRPYQRQIVHLRPRQGPLSSWARDRLLSLDRQESTPISPRSGDAGRRRVLLASTAGSGPGQVQLVEWAGLYWGDELRGDADRH